MWRIRNYYLKTINLDSLVPGRNPRYGCRRIAQQIAKAFGVDVDKDLLRRVLTEHYRPGSNDGGPSWLTFLGHTKDSLWSIDLFRYHRWQANLRILDVKEIKSVPYIPLSHPFVERLIGTIRREYLDHARFLNASDLERKLEEFRHYYNTHRVHTSLDGDTPSETSGEVMICRADLNKFRWKAHCRGLFQLPVAA